jgi:glycosyltransferase involved in cell wall biosynthesis
MINDRLPAIRFFGRPQMKSGYGNAVVNMCLALSRSKTPVRFEIEKGKKLFKEELNNFKGNPKIDLYLQTPPFDKHKTNNYKIGYFYWEADTLPKIWAKDIKKNINELWVPCELTRSACLKSGFRGPIEILHTPCNIDVVFSKVEIPAPMTKDFVLSDDTFKFYSVFQWHERKGYNELLRAYYKEFDENDNVVLILKVNPIKNTSNNILKIKSDILKIKRMANKKALPKVYLITDYINRDALIGLHRLCDAFVLPHHGEGWGMPIHDAMLCDSQIITTKFGGITELLNDDNAFIINHDIRPVKSMRWNPWYHSYQKWAYPKIAHLRVLMRDVFENKKEYLYKTQKAKALAKSLDISSCSLRIEEILSKKRFKRFL